MSGASATRVSPTALGLALGYFLLLAWFYIVDVYHQHFFDHGAIVVGWQIARFIAIFYLLWLQYAVGAYGLYLLGGRRFPLSGVAHFIAAFLLGTSLWHIALLVIGLAGWLFYPVLLLLTGTVMLLSIPHLAGLFQRVHRPRGMARDEKLMALLTIAAAMVFVLLKGAYPSGGHDFFNHYFTYYKEVAESGSLGPHATWYHYYYSKGLGVYFLSMVLFDPFAIHLVATTFVVVAACMVFDWLQKPGGSRVLPLFGVFLYLMCYIYTSGRGLFAANGGWGDLEKTHELTAVLLLAIIWLVRKAVASREMFYAPVLYAVCAANVIIGFASGLLAGLFCAVALLFFAMRRDAFGQRILFFAGAATGASMLAILLINYVNTGVPQDQLAHLLWPILDWQKVVKLGYTLELYSHLNDLMSYERNSLPLMPMLYKMLVEYYRLYMLWPLLLIGVALYISRRRLQTIKGSGAILCFLITSYIFAVFFGGRSQFISFFRFSTFNYAPTLILCLLLWRVASERVQRVAVFGTLAVAGALVVWGANNSPVDEGRVTFPVWMHFKVGEWEKLADAAIALNTGRASIDEAVSNQRGRVGRMRWGGVYPPMREIYAALPPHTRIWSMHNHSYCLLPACNVGQYFSQVTSPRWYDIALGSVEDGKKIMQEEGLNFIFYSRSIPVVPAADAKDQLAGFYKGLAPENIDKTFGILWTNGWDYLLTWKEYSAAPLDADFMESWRLFQKTLVASRKQMFQTDKLATMVKKAAEDPNVIHPPRPEWLARP